MVNRLMISLLFFIVATFAKAQIYTLEAPGADPTLVVRGDEIKIESFNKVENTKVFLYQATAYSNLSGKEISGIVINNSFVVLAVLERTKFEASNFREPSCFIGVIAGTPQENFFLKKFSKGDLCKLRKDGDILDWQNVSEKSNFGFKLLNESYTTVDRPDFTIEGRLNSEVKPLFKLNDKVVSPTFEKNTFKIQYTLKPGVNYIRLTLWDKKTQQSEQELIVFYKDKSDENKQLVLWVEQFPNAKTLTSTAAIDSMLALAKQAGFTTIALDVKGPEGYVSYRKNNYSNSPYLTATKNPKKQTEDTGFDLLDAMIQGVRKLDLRIIVSFNFFTEGNITAQDYAVLEQHPTWEEVVQRPEDKGQILKISESFAGQEAKAGKRIALAFVNPVDKNVQDFQLLRVKEVLENYDIDGIVLDRTRYDNLYADFSATSEVAFREYLKAKSKVLTKFPNDAFRIDDKGNMQEGALFKEWITFRSSVIRDFTTRVRKEIDTFNLLKNKKVLLAAYVGSWYESYYQNGVNWACPDFKYQASLKFPKPEIYTPEYAATSYLPYLDFLMIGTYYKTDKEIKKYTTLGNILTGGKLPLLAGISLPDLNEDSRTEVFRSAVHNSSGIMIFDLCYINWNSFLDQFRNNEK